MQQQATSHNRHHPKPKKKIRVPRVVNGVEQMVEIEVDADAGPGWGPNDKHKLLNHRITRVDGPLKATGVAHYTYDQRLPGMLYAPHSSLPTRPRARHEDSTPTPPQRFPACRQSFRRR